MVRSSVIRRAAVALLGALIGSLWWRSSCPPATMQWMAPGPRWLCRCDSGAAWWTYPATCEVLPGPGPRYEAQVP